MFAIFYLRVMFLAGVITTLFNFNVINFDEEVLIGIVSCFFFMTVVLLTRRLMKAQFFREMDMLFMIFAYLVWSNKDDLLEGQRLKDWARLQVLGHEVWLSGISANLDLQVTNIVRFERFGAVRRAAALKNLTSKSTTLSQ